LQIAIVIPTYNERSNVERLVPEIERATRDILHSSLNKESPAQTKNEIHIVIVDDDSSDGTGDAVLLMASRVDNIHLIKRPRKMGLGSAYRDAFEWITKNLDAKVIIQMDADLSHPPNLLSKMIKLVGDGSTDVVVASRYLETGGSENWPIHRRIISKGANWLAKSVLGIKVNDITSGYRAYNASCISELLSSNFSSSGYDYQIEVLYILSRLGKKVTEIPFIFANREEGKSKLGIKDILRFASTVLKLRFHSANRTKVHVMAS